MSNELNSFDEIVSALKKREFPFFYAERNAIDTEYQVYAPATDEFEVEDLIILKEAMIEGIKIIDEEINSINRTINE